MDGETGNRQLTLLGSERPGRASRVTGQPPLPDGVRKRVVGANS